MSKSKSSKSSPAVGAGEQPGAASRGAAPVSASAPTSSTPESAQPGDVQTGTGSAAADKQTEAASQDAASVGTGTLRIRNAAVDSDVPVEVLVSAAATVEGATDIVSARRYEDRDVVVVMTPTRVTKIDVPRGDA